ncbi:MAG: hypothetical protein QW231_02560, partial [Candidatus Bathyarchaeia archaeon]
TIQNSRGTLLLDETERLHEADRGTEFRAILLSGYKRGSYAIRCEGEEGKRKIPTKFEVYGPKAIANIQGIEDILEDRCISFTMLRALGPQRNREIEETDPAWGKLRDRLYRLFLGSFKEVQEAYRSLSESEEGERPEEEGKGEGKGDAVSEVSAVSEVPLEKGIKAKEVPIETRELELWKPIFSLASFFEDRGIPSLTEEMRDLAEDVARQRFVENITESMDMLLAQSLRGLVAKDAWYSTKEVMEALEKTYGEELPQWLNTK